VFLVACEENINICQNSLLLCFIIPAPKIFSPIGKYFYMNNTHFTLPLENPVLIFTLILFIILFAPIVLNKLKIPHLIGLIIAGAIIGPNALNLMLRDSSIVLFGTVGLLYIMFLAGIEIDLADFKKNKNKSIVFGLYTFTIPMIMGTLLGIYILGFSTITSVLMASMFASHTLVAFPIMSKFGVTKNRAVSITLGGTMITDTLALLVLAVIAKMSTGTEITGDFWITLVISLLIFGLIVTLLFPLIGRWFFKHYDDNISQYIFVLGLVFLASFLAEAAGIEAIIGAFLAGLALNRLIPHTSPLMNRIEFVGNALFIPFFLIGVGMLIDFRVLFTDPTSIIVAISMTVVATVAKFLAAWVTQKTFRFSVDERHIIFGLSNAQAAATLAAVLIGFNIIIGTDLAGNPIRLLNESILNGTILMILVTCTIASLVAQKGARNLSITDAIEGTTPEDHVSDEKILIPISYPENIDELINLGVTIKSKRRNTKLYVLNIVPSHSTDSTEEKKARKLLEKASISAAATDTIVKQLLRYDLNIVNGITNVVKEQKITDMVLGLHKQTGITDSFLGNLTKGILTKCNVTTIIYRPVQPLNTINRYFIFVPERAEREVGFGFWLIRIWNIGRNTGGRMVFYASIETIGYLKEVHKNHPIEAMFINFTEWDDFLIISRELKENDALLIVMSRKESISYHSSMTKIPKYLNKYFNNVNYALIYPMQQGYTEKDSIDYKNVSMIDPLLYNLEKLDDLGKTLYRMFKK
jgi:Kef-type K+ transport system membrane component KefB/nucleotide-binding universal stress UspA family protein